MANSISNLKKNKSAQLFIIGGFFIILSFIFIYSLETENYYIISPPKSSLLSNIIYETCQVATTTNGSFIDSRFSDFETSLENYCSDLNINCDLIISKNLGAPVDLALLDYTYYNYSIIYENSGYSYLGNFTCD